MRAGCGAPGPRACAPEEHDVWLRPVDRVVHPSPRLLHAEAPPLRLGGHAMGRPRGAASGAAGGRERESETTSARERPHSIRAGPHGAARSRGAARALPRDPGSTRTRLLHPTASLKIAPVAQARRRGRVASNPPVVSSPPFPAEPSRAAHLRQQTTLRQQLGDVLRKDDVPAGAWAGRGPASRAGLRISGASGGGHAPAPTCTRTRRRNTSRCTGCAVPSLLPADLSLRPPPRRALPRSSVAEPALYSSRR